eukprot:1219994-Prymnesium_polylepis.1
MLEEGLRGSKYAGHVVKMRRPRAALVEFDEFTAEEDESRQLQEWLGTELLSPVPPSPPPRWLRGVTIGEQLELLHEGGWWPV